MTDTINTGQCITAIVNGQPMQLVASSSVNDLLAQLKIEHAAIAVEINGQIVTRDCFEETQLQNKDAVEVVSLVGGG